MDRVGRRGGDQTTQESEGVTISRSSPGDVNSPAFFRLRAGLKYLKRDGGAGLCVSEGVVVAGEGIAAGGGDGLELVVGEAVAKVAPGCT